MDVHTLIQGVQKYPVPQTKFFIKNIRVGWQRERFNRCICVWLVQCYLFSPTTNHALSSLLVSYHSLWPLTNQSILVENFFRGTRYFWAPCTSTHDECCWNWLNRLLSENKGYRGKIRRLFEYLLINVDTRRSCRTTTWCSPLSTVHTAYYIVHTIRIITKCSHFERFTVHS